MANTYDIGDVIRVTGTWTDTDGTAVDPGALTFSFKDPSDNSTTYTYDTDAELVKDATGVYYVDVTIDEEGTWFYRFASTSSNVAAAEGYFFAAPSQF